MATSSINIKEATVIPPADQTPNHTLALSALDSQLFLRFTIEYLLVYKPNGSDSTALVARVKSALSKALVPYYPLAGRVRPRTDGNGLEVVCRGQGALFINAEENDSTFAEFARAPRRVTQWRKLLSFHVVDVLLGAPVVVIQLTWLKDGTVTLGVGFNHCVCDGIGSAEFLNLFAQLTRGRLSEIKPYPVWQRHLLTHHRVESVSRRYNIHDIHHPEFVKVPDLSNFVSRFNNERLIPTSITFDKRCLTELKRLVNSPSRISELNINSSYTSFEVLAGHIWRSWARSLNLPLNQTLKLLFSVNVRERVKPSLPSGFYGNAFVLGCAQTSVKELTEKGLSHASMLVKRAKDRVDTEYVKSVVESVSGSTCPDSVGVLILTQWSRLGLERVDFGLGKPVHVAPICCDRYCLFLPVYNQTDAVRVMVAVPMSGVEKYERLVRECMVR